MNNSLVQKAYAVIIRFDPNEGCKLLVLATKSVGYDFYRLPGGNVEADETPLQAAYRETHEESGIENLQFIRKIGTTRYFKPFIQSEVERTDYLFEAESGLPDKWEWIGTVGSEVGVVFAFSWISPSSIARVDPELRTFLTPDYIPELFGGHTEGAEHGLFIKEGSSYFAAIADSYDRLQPILSPPYSKGLEMIVELIPFDPDDAFEFVELGCGTAEPTARVLDRFRNAAGTCVDSEPEMLSLARKKLGPHSDRAEVLEANMASCDIRECDLVLSAKTVHHLSPACLPELFTRIAGALRPRGCFILYDAMAIGPSSGPGSRSLSSRFRRLHLQRAVASGMATQEEIDARQEYKRRMKAAGKDVEFEHRAEDLIGAMAQAGFDEVAVVWRMFADTILLAFTPEAATKCHRT